MTLDNLIAKISKGDIPSFEQLYAKTKKAVYCVAFSIVRDKSLAEDVMQTVYLNILKNASSYKVGTNADAWIYAIARNEALLAKKRSGREFSVDEQQNAAMFGSKDIDDYGFLIDIARRILSKDEFTILLLITAGGYKRREIAKMFGVPVSTVTYKYQCATQKMRKEIEK